MEQQRTGNPVTRKNEELDTIDLVAFFGGVIRILKKLWWVVIALAIMASSLYCSYKYIQYSPIYRCQATFTVGTESNTTGSYSFYYSETLAGQLSQTFPYILNSSYFNSVLLSEMGTDNLGGTLSAEVLDNSNVITMTAESSNAEDAYALLEAALEVYPSAAKFVLGDIQFYMLNEASLPSQPYNQVNYLKTAGVGGMAGAVVGLAIMAILVLFGKTVKTPDEMKQISSLKCLAIIPENKRKARRTAQKKEISVLDSRISHGYKESIRALQIRMERQMEKQGKKVLMITSTAPGEGKSTVTINLAEMLAASGKKVLLVDGDFRKQDLAKKLNCVEDPDQTQLNENFSVCKVDKKGFWLLRGTRKSENLIEILSSSVLGEVIDKQKEKMDYVILDTPPCGSFQDAALIAEYADGILYVIRYDYATRQKILEGLSFLQEEGSKFLGYVFSFYSDNTGSYGYGSYRYGYGYGHYKYGYGYGKRSKREKEKESETEEYSD